MTNISSPISHLLFLFPTLLPGNQQIIRAAVKLFRFTKRQRTISNRIYTDGITESRKKFAPIF